MEDLSLHILDIAENAIRADAKTIKIEIVEDESKDQLAICIEDDGKGMDKETVSKVLDPFFTTKSGKRTGLGLALLSQAAQQTGGDLRIDSERGRGTKVTAIFQFSHPDMKPMGDILQTMATLLTADPSIRFIYDYQAGDQSLHFDSHE
ncbi:ATP-binding protein [Candidatus Poribacteria bacterium]